MENYVKLCNTSVIRVLERNKLENKVEKIWKKYRAKISQISLKISVYRFGGSQQTFSMVNGKKIMPRYIIVKLLKR